MATSITTTCTITMSLRSAGTRPGGRVVLDQGDREQHEHDGHHVEADGLDACVNDSSTCQTSTIAHDTSTIDS